jgi:hypothetical protein
MVKAKMFIEPHKLHCLPDSIRVVRGTKTRWAGHTASSGSFLPILLKNVKGTVHSGNKDVDGQILSGGP